MKVFAVCMFMLAYNLVVLWKIWINWHRLMRRQNKIITFTTIIEALLT
jgi:hypothetical protein